MTEISRSTFSGCESLKEIKIPDFVTNIGIGTFSGCKSLTELFIPKSVTLIGTEWGRPGNCDFVKGCTSLRSLEVEDGNPVYHSKDNCIIETKTGTLFAISENGVIPSDGSVIKIGENAFCASENMTEISLPECITEIGSDAFSVLSNLKKINIPKGVNNIGRNAFFDTWKEYRPDVAEEENGIYYVGNWAVGVVGKKLARTYSMDSFAPSASTSEEAITLREGTVGICANAFSDSEIQSVSLPNSLKYICEGAFTSCNNLKSISIPEGVEKIGDYAFNACRGLESVILRDGLISIGDAAFNCCEKLQSVTVPHTVKSIGRDAFRFCKGLQSLVIPDIELEIGRDAFAYCADIPNIDIPERILSQLTHFLSTDEEDEGGFGEKAEAYEGGDKITADFTDNGDFSF